MKPWQGRLVGCVLTLSVAAGLTSCTEPQPQPPPSPTPTVSSPFPSRVTSPTPSAEELDLRGAEQAVSRFWRVIDRLSADPESDLTELATVSRGSVAAQWARAINQYRYDRVTTKGRVAVRDASGRQSQVRSHSAEHWEAHDVGFDKPRGTPEATSQRPIAPDLSRMNMPLARSGRSRVDIRVTLVDTG